jgi:hypothetical protein
VFHNHCRDDDSGVGWLLFACLMFAVMIASFTIAYAALHLWAVSTLLLRLSERQWLRATGWAMVLALLIYIDWQAWAASAGANQ